MNKHDLYEKAYQEIERFDALVMAVIRSQNLTRIPFHEGEDKSIPIEQRLSHTLVMLSSQLAELLDNGVNPSGIIRTFQQGIQDSYIHPASSEELMGTPASKRASAAEKIADLILKAIDSKSLSDDMKAII